MRAPFRLLWTAVSCGVQWAASGVCGSQVDVQLDVVGGAVRSGIGGVNPSGGGDFVAGVHNASGWCNEWLRRNGVGLHPALVVAEDCAAYQPCQLVVVANSHDQNDTSSASGGPVDAAATASADGAAARMGRGSALPPGVVMRIPRRLFVRPSSPALASPTLERLLRDPLLRGGALSDASRLLLRLFMLLHEKPSGARAAAGGDGSGSGDAKSVGGPVDLAALDPDGVADWLHAPAQNLGQFADVFLAAGVDGEALEAMDLEDLGELGVGLRIHRKRLLRVVAQAIQARAQYTEQAAAPVDGAAACETADCSAAAAAAAAAAAGGGPVGAPLLSPRGGAEETKPSASDGGAPATNEENEEEAARVRAVVAAWFATVLQRPYVQDRLLQFTSRDLVQLQRHAGELQTFFAGYFSVVNGQRHHVEAWVDAHRATLERHLAGGATRLLLDAAWFTQAYSFVQTRMVASPTAVSVAGLYGGDDDDAGSVMLVPGLGLFNHFAPQVQSIALDRKYNCSFLWEGSPGSVVLNGGSVTTTVNNIYDDDADNNDDISKTGSGGGGSDRDGVVATYGSAAFAFSADGSGAVEVHAAALPPVPGAELRLHYGTMNNYHLLTRYGFAVPFNKFDTVKVQLGGGATRHHGADAAGAPASRHTWATVTLPAHSIHAQHPAPKAAVGGDVPLRLVRDHGKHSVVVEILGTKTQVFEVGYDGTLPATLLAAVRYLVGTVSSGDDPELAALGAPAAPERLAEVTRRLAHGQPVSRASEARTLRFLREAFEGTLRDYATSLRDDVELLRTVVAGNLPTSVRSAIAVRLTAKAILELTIDRFDDALHALEWEGEEERRGPPDHSEPQVLFHPRPPVHVDE